MGVRPLGMRRTLVADVRVDYRRELDRHASTFHRRAAFITTATMLPDSMRVWLDRAIRLVAER